MKKSNIELRLNQRRAFGENIIAYIDPILRSEHYKANPTVTFEDFRPFLSDDEVQGYEKMMEERAQAQAEAEARANARREEECRKWQENKRLLDAYWEKNIPNPLTTLPECEVDEEGKDLFDIYARYHIAKVECEFDSVDYYREYGEERMGMLEGTTINVWLKDGTEALEIETQLPGDDDNSTIGEFIVRSIKDVATEYVYKAAVSGKVLSGTVNFNIADRTISLSVEMEVTREETFEGSWTV
jgi:hypothetical protein